MPDRTVKVNLVANAAGYIAGMEAAAVKTRQLGTAAEKLAAQRQGFDVLGRSMIVVGALAAAAVGVAIKEFAEFDAKMSQVQALSHASADEMNALSTAALHMGQAIGFSATQVADAEIELVKAGISVSNIMGGALQGSLRLAAAGQIDVAKATEIATIAMTQFGLKGAQIPHVADLLTAGADKALGGVADLGEALKSGGLIANQFGVSLDETIGTLSAFANAGLIGEVAGTDLRQMLLKLAAPAADSQKAMDKFGISIYDASGKFVGISNLAGQLHDKLGGLTEATRNSTLATIFGARAIAGANVLYKEGASGISDWTNKVDDSGFAAKQAAAKMDNLQGDISKLGAAFQTDLIESGSSADDVLRSLTQGLTGLVGLVGDMPAPVLGAGLALTAIIGIIGLVGGTALIAVPKIAQFKVALKTLEVSGRSVASGLGVASLAMAGAVVVLGALAAQQAQATARTDSFKASLNQATGELTKYTREVAISNLQSPFDSLSGKSLADIASDAGISLRELADAVESGGPALDKVADKITKYGNTLSEFQGASTVRNAAQSLHDMNGQLTQSQKEWRDAAAAAKSGVGSTQDAGDAYKATADQAANLNSQLSDLIDTFNKANGIGQDAVSTNAAYRQSLADVADYIAKAKKGVAGYALGLDEHTAAGSKNAAMLSDLAKKNEDAAKAQFALDGNTDNYVATVTAGHNTIVAQAEALGASAAQAEALANKVAAIPTAALIKILVDDAEAKNHLNILSGKIRQLVGNATLHVNIAQANENGGKYIGGAQAFQDGGMPNGRYAGRAGGIRMFAEQNVGSEWYISQKPGQESRNLALAMDAVKTLGGGQREHYAPTVVGGTTIIRNYTVTVPVQAGLVTDRSQLAQTLTKVVTEAVRDGSVDKDWNG